MAPLCRVSSSGTHYVTQAGFELTNIVPQPPKYWIKRIRTVIGLKMLHLLIIQKRYIANYKHFHQQNIRSQRKLISSYSHHSNTFDEQFSSDEKKLSQSNNCPIFFVAQTLFMLNGSVSTLSAGMNHVLKYSIPSQSTSKEYKTVEC